MTEKHTNVHVLYKKLGETPLECVKRFKMSELEKNKEFPQISMTYAGRLDPMAEGLLLVLAGEEIINKDKYLGLTKKYEFEILWGMQTDTGDVLGMHTLPPDVGDQVIPTQKDIENYFKKNIGKLEQKYPAYSSRTVAGKSLIEWSRLGRIREVEIPLHEVELLSAEYISRKFFSSLDLLKQIEEKVHLVQGDFRQEKIMQLWRELLSGDSEKKYTSDLCRISVSSGFYVRQFVSDIAENFQTMGTTYSIKRTKIGDFHSPTDLQ